MTEMNRRLFLRSVGRGSLAVALVGVAACSDDEPASETTSAPTTPPSSTTATPGESTTVTTLTEATQPSDVGGQWSQVDSVAAYLFVRSGEAAIVDTGNGGNAGRVESALGALGVAYADLSTVILTHRHGDHVGSLAEIMNAAPGATAYAGAEDIPNISSPRPISSVADGDSVFGLTVIATPGHTPGHISILDPSGVLVAGDALNGANGGIVGPNSQFTPDMDTANQSVMKLAGFEYEVVYFGHGDAVTQNGSAQVADLAAGL